MTKFPYKRIITISDLHFGVHSNSFEWFNRQLDYFNEFLIPILNDYEQKFPNENVLWVMGDVFDSRQVLNLKILWEVKQLFDKISKIMPIHILVGNHDIYYLDNNEVTSVDFLNNERIRVWKEPEVVKYHNTSVLIMPWRKSKQDIIDCVGSFDADLLFCHCDINELKTNIKSPRVDYGIDPKLFEKFKQVLSGHIHLRQEYKNILMLGNNQHTTRADIDNDKFVDIWELDKDEKSWHTSIKNNVSPRYIKKRLDDLLLLDKKSLQTLTQHQLVDVEIDHQFLIDNSVKCNLLLKQIEEYAEELKSFVVYSDTNEVHELDENVVQTYDIELILNEFLKKTQYSTSIVERAIKVFKEIREELNQEQ